jgi:hypothetical protein
LFVEEKKEKKKLLRHSPERERGRHLGGKRNKKRMRAKTEKVKRVQKGIEKLLGKILNMKGKRFKELN